MATITRKTRHKTRRLKNSSTKKNKRVKTHRRHPFPWNPIWVRKSPFVDIQSAKLAEYNWKHNGGQSAIGFTATSSLKSMGRIPRTHGKYEIGNKYLML